MANKIEFNGKIYNSVKELAERHDINYGTLKYRLSQKMPLEEALKQDRKQHTNKSENITYKGKKYHSYKELADDLNVKYELLIARLNAGHSLKNAITGDIHEYIIFEGEKFTSYSELAKKKGVNYKTLMSRLDKGLELKDALSNKRVSIRRINN